MTHVTGEGLIVSLVCSDYKGRSCLHHAASEGYTQTMDILLSANIKLLDNEDEDGGLLNTLCCHAVALQHCEVAGLKVEPSARAGHKADVHPGV